METPSRIFAQIKPNFRRRKDHTATWSKIANRTHRYNRMDPDPEPESDVSPPQTRPTTKRNRDGKIKLILTKEDWRRFWSERLRKLVDAPHLTDKDLADAVERSRRIFLRHREETYKPHVDPDIPPCYYWNKFEVADWVGSAGLPDSVQKMFSHFGICGRDLITLDASKLMKMGLYELRTIKEVTKAVRGILGLPHTNGLRAIARVPPLETFLKLKVRTGPQIDKFTFKEFCEQQRIEYEPALKQMAEGFRPIPGCCQVEIKPDPKAQVKWIPVKVHKPKRRSKTDHDYEPSDSDLSKGSSESLLDDIPTVEELTRNAVLRNTFIPQLLNEIVEAVFEKVRENKKNQRECRKQKQELANEVVKYQLDKAYSDFHITAPEDKLKFVTIIAEELVEDILRAREILQDMENFEKRMNTEIPEEDMRSTQQAVAYYVQNIMPVVVSAALKEMERSSTNLHCELDNDDSSFNDSISDDSLQNEIESEVEQTEEEEEEETNNEAEVIWNRALTEERETSESEHSI